MGHACPRLFLQNCIMLVSDVLIQVAQIQAVAVIFRYIPVLCETAIIDKVDSLIKIRKDRKHCRIYD